MYDAPHLDLNTYLVLGLRNLWRNPRRTLITLASLVVGIAALTFLGALNDGWLEEMKGNFILTLTGHVQVHARGFEESQSLRDLIADPAPITAIADHDPNVRGWALRLRTSGLAAVAGNSSGVQIMAISARQEPRVTRMSENICEGLWLRPGADKDLLLGRTVADNLGAAVGDRVVLMLQRPGGDMVSEVFHLRGVLCAGAPQVDRTMAMVPLATVQQLLGVGRAVTDVVIRANSHGLTEAIAQRLIERLPGARYEVMGWQDLDPMVRQWLEFSDAYSLVVILVVVALVLAEVLNTMLMALHERTREFGVMQSLGTRKSQLFIMIVIEGVLLIMSGAMLGYLAGAVAIQGFQENGIDLSQFANAFKFFYMSPVIRPILTPETEMRVIGTTLFAALFAGLYPAWKATRIEAVDALRRG